MDDAERARRGMAVRREVLGDEHVDRAVAATTPFTEPFQDLITRYAWGEIWSRPGLSRQERSLVTLAVLAAMQHEHELAMHVKAALRNGLTPEAIQEVLLQVAVYAGVPVANRAFPVAQRALAEAAAADDRANEARARLNQARPLTPLSAAPVLRAGTLSARHTCASDMRKPGSPAAKAGLKAGDVLIQFGDKPIKNLYDFTDALRRSRVGDVVPVTVLRDGKELKVDVKLEQRK